MVFYLFFIMRKLPLYEAILENEQDGITCISWVSCPATEVQMMLFDEQHILQFADEEKHMISSVVMLCDTPIYRRNGDYEFYIQYGKDTLLKMCEKMLADNAFKNISFEHNGKVIDEGLINLVELYTTDEHKTSPFDVKQGSIIATYKVNDNELWEAIKESNLGGISLEGYFSLNEIKEQHFNKSNMIKDILKKFLTNFSETTIGDKKWLHDGELEVGTKVTNEDGSEVEDGEYTLEDGTKITIKDGAVKSVEKAEEETPETTEEKPEAQSEEKPNEDETSETETETSEETTETETETTSEETSETQSEGPSLQAEVDALKAEIEALKNSIEEIKTSVNEALTVPVAAPAVEEFEQVETKTHKGSNTSNILSHLK